MLNMLILNNNTLLACQQTREGREREKEREREERRGGERK
jgi:hypothetical protein